LARVAQAGREQAILEAARGEFARRGYHGARMSAIAEAAGIADGTVYLYFRNKQELLVAVFRSGIATYMAGLEADLAGARDALEELARLLRFHLVYLGRSPELARIAQVELRQSDVQVRAAVAAAAAPLFERIDAVVRRGREEGSVRTDVDPRIIRRMVFGTLDECVSAWVDAHHGYALESVGDDVQRLLLGGIAR
jgi:TetR/AcrR family transcriptional regulator, fatty acid metabolism regulator protein